VHFFHPIQPMKLRPFPALLSLLLLGLLLGGCATPEATPKPAAKPVASTPKSVSSPAAVPSPAFPTIAAPVFPSPPTPASASLSKEAAAVVVHLTDTAQTDTLAHDIVDTTGFPEAIASLAPGAQAPKVEQVDTRGQPPPRGLTADGDSISLVERDWTGLVLVPINKSLSKAYTTAVRLLKVEAHPLKDGRIRVWIRMQNVGHKQLPSEIACTFNMRGDTQPMSPNFYELEVPSREYRDVFFVSPVGELTAYTVLIRPNRLSGR
jgi:hypothetical protein